MEDLQKKSAEEIYTIIKKGMNPAWSEKDIAIMVAKIYAEQCCEDLRERIAEAAKVNFDCNVWNCEGQSVNKDSIRSVEIILE